MRTHRFATTAGFALSLSVVALGATQADGTRSGDCALIGPHVTFMDYVGPPATLKEMFQAATAVDHIRVLTQGPPTADQPGPHPHVVRHDDAQVLEAFKNNSNGAAGSTLRIEQFGGTIVLDGETVATACPAPVLKPNAEAVVFLHSSQDGEYVTAWGSGGLFIIDTAAATAAVPSSVRYHVAEFKDRPTVPLDGFLQELRAIANSSKPGHEQPPR